jgi:hypothetical protein
MITLGLIPSWQFSPDPDINPMVNPFVTMPPGLPQAGVWSVQPVSTSAPIAPLSGCTLPLGYVMVDEGVPFQMPPRNLGEITAWSWMYDHRNELAWGVGAVLAVSLGIALFG